MNSTIKNQDPKKIERRRTRGKPHCAAVPLKEAALPVGNGPSGAVVGAAAQLARRPRGQPLEGRAAAAERPRRRQSGRGARRGKAGEGAEAHGDERRARGRPEVGGGGLGSAAKRSERFGLGAGIQRRLRVGRALGAEEVVNALHHASHLL